MRAPLTRVRIPPGVHMPNKNYENFKGPKPPANKKPSNPQLKADKTANWPGVPGRTQPKDRSAGVKKIRQTLKSEGI